MEQETPHNASDTWVYETHTVRSDNNPGKETSRLSVLLGATLLFVLLAFGAVAVVTDPTARQNSDANVAAVTGSDPFANVALAGKGAVVFDMTSGKTLYARNADAQLPLASLAKVALVAAAAEVLKPESAIMLPREVRGTGGALLSAGERLQVRDLMDFTLVSSSNDGAELLAELADAPLFARYPSFDEHSTLSRMNALAQELGLSQTYFLNVSGLDISTTLSGSYGSARDVATLFAYAASAYPGVFSETARSGILLTSETGAQLRARNTNEAEGEIPGLIMGKTGFTDLAGGNLAVVFDVGIAHPIVVVILGSTEDGRFEDTKKLIEATRAMIMSTAL